MLTVWSDLASDLPGILLFLLWLALPPLYLIVLGRSYLRRYEILYEQLRDHGCECVCCREPEKHPEEIGHRILATTNSVNWHRKWGDLSCLPHGRTGNC